MEDTAMTGVIWLISIIGLWVGVYLVSRGWMNNFLMFLFGLVISAVTQLWVADMIAATSIFPVVIVGIIAATGLGSEQALKDRECGRAPDVLPEDNDNG